MMTFCLADAPLQHNFCSGTRRPSADRKSNSAPTSGGRARASPGPPPALPAPPRPRPLAQDASGWKQNPTWLAPLSGYHGVSQWEGSPGAGGSRLRAPAARPGPGGLGGRRGGAVRGGGAVSALQHHPPAADLRQVRSERRFRLLRRPRPGEVRRPPRPYCLFPRVAPQLRAGGWSPRPGSGPRTPSRGGGERERSCFAPREQGRGRGLDEGRSPFPHNSPERSLTPLCSGKWIDGDSGEVSPCCCLRVVVSALCCTPIQSLI